ncbi:M1 family metallopeptidase [Dyella nitratireducens]|uniref:Aminopeptidase N n=1 Tax=Dyella nitratireducens TaxID=1849580 RepID=A0ABQ1FRR3_9GAMM|nr:M1 family metallopeptidase [Dyella nitratireducens]GGA25027.1 peptidase M1 [Dyella nitratireducens]GLQ43746.1 peptidase M1 [Dyella nitratireducens]
MRPLRPALLALSLTLGLIGYASAQNHQPPLTTLTENSGGVMPPEQKRVHFDHAELHIAVDPAQQRIDATTALSFTAREPTDVLVLDLDRNLPISAIEVDGKPLAPSAWSNPEGRLRIQLPNALSAGEHVSATVHYGGQPHVAKKAPWDGGFVWSHTKDGQPWVGSAVEGEGCDLFWPCIDHPQGKPDLVDLYVTVPKPLVAPGNGVLVGISDEGDKQTYHWRAKHPTTYAISINVGPFKELTGEYHSRYGNVIPLQYWYLPGEEEQARKLFAEFSRMLAFNEAMIGPYPFGDEKMGVVETPYLGMEHQTINAYGNDYKKDGGGFDWLLQHEFAHEWFGNQMTNADWDDMWLHEAFATYMQPLYSQSINGDMGYYAWLQKMRLALRDHFPIVSGKSQTEEQVYDDDHGPGLDIYDKGALMLHSLRGLIGDRDFFASLRVLVYGRPDPKPGNFAPHYASSHDFIAIVNKVTGRDLSWFFDVYLYQAELPALDQQRAGNTLTLRWRVPHDLPFPMPVEVQVGETLRTLPMTHGEGSLEVPADALVIIDPHSKLLRDLPQVTEYQQWEKAQKAAQSKAKSG